MEPEDRAQLNLIKMTMSNIMELSEKKAFREKSMHSILTGVPNEISLAL